MNVKYMMPKQKVLLWLILFCCLLLVGCTRNNTPQWWHRAEIAYILKEPLTRLIAISIVWCWAVGIVLYIASAGEVNGWLIFFSPLLLWLGLVVVSIVLNIIIIPLLTE
jgi:hypothetical protein